MQPQRLAFPHRISTESSRKGTMAETVSEKVLLWLYHLGGPCLKIYNVDLLTQYCRTTKMIGQKASSRTKTVVHQIFRSSIADS